MAQKGRLRLPPRRGRLVLLRRASEAGLGLSDLSGPEGHPLRSELTRMYRPTVHCKMDFGVGKRSCINVFSL